MEFNIKKLIASFLVFSAIAGTFSLVLRDIRYGQNEDNDLGLNKGGLANAFSGDSFGDNLGVVEGGQESDLQSKNLTERLARSVFEKVISSNPNGFEINEQGEVVGNPASSQDIEVVLSQIEASDLNPREISDDELEITNENSAKNIDKYFRDLARVLLSVLSSDDYVQSLAQAPNLEKLKKMEKLLDKADRDLRAAVVPSDALDVHKNILSYIRNRKDLFSNISVYEKDPARTILALRKQEAFLKSNLRDFRINVNQLISLHPDLKIEAPKKISFLEGVKNEFLGLFSVKEAHAIPVIDAIANALEGTELGTLITTLTTTISTLETSIGSYVQDILEWAQTIATEQLKNYLTKLFVQQVLGWTNNDGNQRFVYNWESFMTDIEEEVTSDALDEVVPSLCGPFREYVLQSQGYLGLSGRSLLGGRSRCPLKDGGANLGNFYKDFSSGGWESYLDSLGPSGNQIGSVLSTDGYVKSRITKATEAKVNELVSNKGYLSQNICADGKEPGRGDVCADGSQPRATTPGGLVGDTLAKAFGAPLDRIVNANDLTDLLAALVNSAISGVLSDSGSKVRGVTGLAVTGLLDRVGSSTSDVVCGGLTGGALSNCLTDAGSTQIVINNNDATTQASSEARKIGSLWQDVRDANKESLDIIAQFTESAKPGLFKGFFDLVRVGEREGDPRLIFPEVPGCPLLYPDISDNTSPHYAERGRRRMEVDTLQSQISGLKTVIQELDSEIDYGELQNDLSSATANSFQTIINTYGTPEAIELKKQTAKNRLTALKTLKSRIESNLAPLATNDDAEDRSVTPRITYSKPITSVCTIELPIDVFAADSPILINP